MTGPAFRYHAAEMKVEFLSCPVQASLRTLGREWAFLVLTAIALFRANRFNDMLRAMPGLSKRLLSMRLAEMEAAGFIVRAETRRGYVRWELTEKGADVVPILLTMVRFGAKWYADELFADGTMRPLAEIFDEGYIRKTLGVTAATAIGPARGSGAPGAGAAGAGGEPARRTGEPERRPAPGPGPRAGTSIVKNRTQSRRLPRRP